MYIEYIYESHALKHKERGPANLLIQMIFVL